MPGDVREFTIQDTEDSSRFFSWTRAERLHIKVMDAPFGFKPM
jgi:hypothetical protein